MSYYRAFKDIHAVMPRDCVMVRAGAFAGHWCCFRGPASIFPIYAPTSTSSFVGRLCRVARWLCPGVDSMLIEDEGADSL
jgi:hypothetical protein